MTLCPDCQMAQQVGTWGLYRDGPCCRARMLAETPRRLQRLAAERLERALPAAEWAAIRDRAREILQARRALDAA